jgi:prolyl-tRNA synthetase
MAQKLPKRTENFAAWYNELVKRAELADNAPVRGCMIIKPYGFAIWEKMQAILDRAFKDTGHSNAYFPLLIPKSYLSREADHIEGFAKECAVVTHYRLKKSNDGQGVVVDPEARLEEELIIRPTSETIVWLTYLQRLDSIVPGLTLADQSVGQYRTLGNASPAFFAYGRGVVARGAYCPCYPRRSRTRGLANAQYLR